ncbi:YrhA family protein [Actinomycetospora soli]|uniref:YrhA family protein n=1 Tax=Actinomycetospora soli TaxID=2893887 RepID=UPI001E57D03C|nr:YrhA family protein [Actinomycetospora soli]MCD2188827.1 SMI1/KNR4 family protein [Actinomycetospora soli]
MTLGEVLARVLADKRRHGEIVRAPAGRAGVAAVRAALSEEFGADLPAAYTEFLQHCDGLDHDGLVLYGSASGPGLVEMNRVWREAPGRADVLVLGDTDMDLLVVTLDGTGPRLLDKVGGDVAGTFPDVTAALVELLTARL